MIVAKIIFLFLPLLLADAQGGGRFGFGRSGFRRPWGRPAVPAPDTPMPTERIIEHVTEPRAKLDLVTITPVTSPPRTSVASLARITPRVQLTTVSPVTRSFKAPVPSLPRFARGPFWARPVFGPKPAAVVSTSTPKLTTQALAIVTPSAELLSPQGNDYSPEGSKTAASEVHSSASSTKPLTSDHHHTAYDAAQNFNPKGQYAPFMSHNVNDQVTESQPAKIHSDDFKMKMESSTTTQGTIDVITEKMTSPAEDHSTNVYYSSTTTKSEIHTMQPTEHPIVDGLAKSENPSSFNPGNHIKPQITEPKPTLEPSSTPRVIIVPAITAPTNNVFYDHHKNNDFSSFNSRGRFPPYMSHHFNGPSTETLPTTTTTTTEKAVPTKSETYSIEPSTNLPFDDENNNYHGIYATTTTTTTTTPVPLKIVSTTEYTPARTNDYQSGTVDTYKERYYESSPKTTPKVVAVNATEPFIDEHKKYVSNEFPSERPAEYAIEHLKTTKAPTYFENNDMSVYPVYPNNNHRQSYYEQSLTNAPERITNPTTEALQYTEPITSETPLVEDQKYVDLTPEPPVEYTSQHGIVTEAPLNSDDYMYGYPGSSKDINNENYYRQSVAPKVVVTTQSAQKYNWHQKATTPQTDLGKAVNQPSVNRYTKMTPKPKPSVRHTTPQPKPSYADKVYDISNFKCQDDGFFAIANQCDDFIECKGGVPVQNSCPDGLHFNHAAKYSEFPCAYPSEVKCESNANSRKPEPTSECPRRYGYFSLPSGGCDKYIMCQEGQATLMSCPPGLAFSVATSSCDWPSNVPDCIPDVFQGFTCPTPEIDDDGNPIHSIYKYRYQNSCKKYIACQKGHPRLLSCDSGLSFDENSESCVDENNIPDCT